MPIKGLSERRRLPRLGKVRLGIVVREPNKKPYPRASDHFVVPPEIMEVTGEAPKSLAIMFPADDPAIIFPQTYKFYKAAGLYCAGDGAQARRWDERGNLREIPCPCPQLDTDECGPVATLNFLLPDVPGIGIWQLVTGNRRSIVGLNTALEMFGRMFGGLTGIPFTLRLEAESLQRFDERQARMVKQTLYVLRLDSSRTLREIVEWQQRAGAPIAALMPAAEEDEADLVEHLKQGAPQGGNGGEDLSVASAETAILGRKVVDSAPQSDSAPVPWTIEACFAAAKRAGIGAEDYALYLSHKHRRAVEDLSPEALLKEGEAWAAAEKSALARETLKSVILTVVGKTKGR